MFLKRCIVPAIATALIGLHNAGAEPVSYQFRLGLSATDNFFVRDEAYRLTSTGYMAGHSASQNISGDPSYTYAGWIAGADGVSHRVGLYDIGGGNEFTAANGNQYSQIQGITETGRTWGTAFRFGGLSQSPYPAAFGTAAWVADSTGITVRVGLTGGQYLRADGYALSSVVDLNESGYGIGNTGRYDGATSTGLAVWYSSPTGVTTRTGFHDQGGGNEFTRADGYQRSSWNGTILDSGYFLGSSERYNGGYTELGVAQFLGHVNGSPLVRVGLYDADGSGEYTRADGYQYSRGSFTETELIYGTASRFAGASSKGTAAWISDVSGQTTRIGFYDQGGGSVYTRNDGWQESDFTSGAGDHLAGWSTRYQGSGSSRGTSAWVSNANGSTTRVGFFDQTGGNEFTRADGFQESKAYAVTASGFATGYSKRYKGGSADLGQAVWRSDASGTVLRIGLYDQAGGNEFTRNDGYQHSVSPDNFLRASGYVSGDSRRYSGGSTSKGIAGWVATPDGTTHRVGLYDQWGGNEYSRADGYQYTEMEVLTNSGYSGGYSERYNGSAIAGYTAWIATPDGATIDLGLTDALHTSSDGARRSDTEWIAESGLAVGMAERYSGTSYNGRTAWVFDPASDQQITFEFSTRASDGFARSAFEGISTSGLAYGTFDLFDGNTNLGERAFIWSADFGTLILDESISGGIAQYGWDNFWDIDFVNSSGMMMGSGVMATGQGVYAVQVVPEPGSAILAAAGAAILLISRRRRQRPAGDLAVAPH